jgi:hypothetical protein
MNVIQTIAAQRQKLLDGIDANQGDINLRIFEDFYPDEAHFIYELLQNAEDAGATEVAFELHPNSCTFEHNGTRHFDERDIRAITGIFNSSKKASADKIGKFGVGFKSVFVYTDTPVVYSAQFSFKILNLVLPQEVSSPPELGGRTRFEFPFNSAKKSAEDAYSEVKAGLEKLSETTLLFLNNLRYIKWKVGQHDGAVLREEHSDVHIEVLKLAEGREILSSHFFRFSAPIENVNSFTAPVDSIARHRLAIAYELSGTSDAKTFEKKLPLAGQLKIVPATKGTVSVFFPAEKETSGLRFHLHAPFVPELSRASIKDSPENRPLFEQLAVLAAKSLHAIKEVGLLTGEFLSVLPHDDDQLPERYNCIRTAICDEMCNEALVPTFEGGFAPARRLLQARAPLKTLLSTEDLAFITGRTDSPAWAIGATQRNSNQDRFLTTLKMKTWDEEALKRFLENRAREKAFQWDRFDLDADVVKWMQAKPFEWFQALYAVLYRHCAITDEYGQLQDVSFIKLRSGDIGTAREAYFETTADISADPLPRVDSRILTTGTKKVQQVDARKLLERLGVREPNEVDELHVLLNSRYGEFGEEPGDKAYVLDLKRMIAFSERNPQQRDLFKRAHIFKVEAPNFDWATPEHVFIDEPFSTTGLRVLHHLLPDEEQRRWPLSKFYLQCGIPIEKLLRFAQDVGCQSQFDSLYASASCYGNPKWDYLSQAPGGRYGNGINRDFALTAAALILLRAKRVDTSLLVWHALCQSESVRPTVLKACYQVTEKGGPLYADSQLVCSLRELAWVPQTGGSFVQPGAATAARLPKGFPVDAGFKWLEAVGFGANEKARAAETAVRAGRRAEFGFKSEEELQRAQAFIKLLPEQQQKRILAEAEQQRDGIELPERAIRNPDLRRQRVGDQAKSTPAKESVVRERSVQVGLAESKAAAKVYLADQYTNSHGKMICQVCKGELPFRLATGAYYFEAVEIVAESEKRYREAYLALCPNHAAAYLYANAQRNTMEELVATAAGKEIEVALGGAVTTIYFTEMHLADVKACLAADNGD